MVSARAASRQRGVALIAVLGFLAVMSLIAIGIVGAARASIDGAARRLLRAQAQSAVESATNVAVLQLIAGRMLAPQVLTAPQEVEVGDFAVTVRARSEASKIDLNFADVALLMGMFRAAGADADRASALASAVLDWRDADDLLHVGGAERADYEAAGVPYVPANRPFESVDELQRVLGVTDEVFTCLRPHLTVHAQRASVDLATASPLVREAASAGPADPQATPPGTSVVAGTAVSAGEVFEVTAEVDDSKRNLRRAERAVVRVTGNARDPFWILSVEPVDKPGAACGNSSSR